MTWPDRSYAGRMGDSLLDRVTRLPFVIPGDPTGVPASVLLALAPVDGADDLELVLVQRPGHLRQHAGQVGLPGGAVEPGDADGVAAALREAQEVGLDPSGVRVLGSLDRAYLAVSDFDVLPVVGVWDGLAPLTRARTRSPGSCGRPCASWPTPPATAPCRSGRSWARRRWPPATFPATSAAPCSGSTGPWSGASPPACWSGSSTPSASGPTPPRLLGRPPLTPTHRGTPWGPRTPPKEHPMTTPRPTTPSPSPNRPAPTRRRRPSRAGAAAPAGRDQRRRDPLVLLHAFPLDGRMWAPQVEALAGTYQVIVPDLRGFGAAGDQAVEEAGMDLLADDLARLLDDRGLDRVVLGGLSLGGYVALAFMRGHADRVSGLVLLDTKATADDDQARDARLEMAERVLAEGNDFVPEVMLPRLLGETSREHRPELVSKVAALIREQPPRPSPAPSGAWPPAPPPPTCSPPSRSRPWS